MTSVANHVAQLAADAKEGAAEAAKAAGTPLTDV